MQSNLRYIIHSRAGSPLSDDYVKYFIYQTLCGLKYIHSADVVYDDLKPADLLVSADCKLKICYFRLAHRFSQAWWYRAPDCVFNLANNGFAIDVWSVGCILAELLKGVPIFRGRDPIEHRKQILCDLGTPSEDTLRRLASPSYCLNPLKGQDYIRSLSIGPRVPFTQMFPPGTNPLAIDLLAKMLTLDPAERITCEQALEHPYLAVRHNITDEPVCPTKIDTSFLKENSIEGMKKLIVEEVDAFRLEVRAEVRSNQSRQLGNDIVASPIRDGAPIDGATSGHYSGQTLQDGDDHSKFDEELPSLLNEIEGILGDGDSHKIVNVLERLTNYNGLDKVRQIIVQNFKNALELRRLLPPNEYLKDVKRETETTGKLGEGTFGNVYKVEWKGKQVAVKMFRPVSPPVFLIPSDTIRWLTLNNLQDHIKGSFKPAVSFHRELLNWTEVSGSNSVWPLLGFTMWLDRDEMTVIYALVSPLAEGHLKLSYLEWQSLKPKRFATYQNILLNEGRCYLIDFGISKCLDYSSSFSFAPVVATAQCIPKGLDSSVTGRNEYSDIYSFGSTMYQVLTREPLNIATGQPNRPRSCLGQEWEAIWDLILRCVSEEQDVRPSAVELVESLTAILNAFPDVVL
ncbi:kinase-like domain-containing protein [Russula emetica]|nr:kinase-like domain-containing protein [Russula emetica]